MNIDDLDKELSKTSTPAPPSTYRPAGFVPMVFPRPEGAYHTHLVQDEETGRVERISIPCLPIDHRDRVHRSSAHMGAVEL